MKIPSARRFFGACASPASQVIYEVSLNLKSLETRAEVIGWLRGAHIIRVLQSKGFLAAELYDSEPNNQIVVRYTVSNKDDLDRYITELAPRLRAEGVERFGSNMIAERRIMSISDTFYK